MIQFGELRVGDTPPVQEVVFSDLCLWGSTEIQWGLDDPDQVFSYTVKDGYTVQFTIDTTKAGSWEAQFSAKHDQNERPVYVQLFATTNASE